MIRKEWWRGNPHVLGEAEGIADRLGFHVERLKVGETIPARPVQRLTLTVEETADALGIS